MLQGVLHQLLGGHVNHIVMAADDVSQLRLHPLGDELRGIVSIEPVHFAIHQPLQILHGVLNGGGKEVVGHRAEGFAHIRNGVGVAHHHLIGLFRTQIGEFLQHFICSTEIQGVGLVAVVKALGGQEDVAVDLVLRV